LLVIAVTANGERHSTRKLRESCRSRLPWAISKHRAQNFWNRFNFLKKFISGKKSISKGIIFFNSCWTTADVSRYSTWIKKYCIFRRIKPTANTRTAMNSKPFGQESRFACYDLAFATGVFVFPRIFPKSC